MSITSRKQAREHAKTMRDINARIEALKERSKEFDKGAPMRLLRAAGARAEKRTEHPGLLARARASVLTHKRGNLDSFPADLVTDLTDALETVRDERDDALMDLRSALGHLSDEDYIKWSESKVIMAKVIASFREVARA